MSKFLKKNYLEIIFITPLLLFVFSFTLIPILQTIQLSFKGKSGGFTFYNYESIFSRLDFGQSVINTISITAIGLAIQMCIGFCIAYILKISFKGRGIIRSIVLMPMGIPTLVSGTAMLYVFGNSGYLNEVFFRLGMITTPIDWFRTVSQALVVVAVADSWKVMPIVVLFLLAGLEAIPSEVNEASKIDGASGFQNLIYVTLPLLKSAITMTVLLRAVDLLRIFELPMILLGQNFKFLGTYAFEEYSYNNYGASAAASTVLLLLIIVFVALYLNFFNREDDIIRGN